MPWVVSSSTSCSIDFSPWINYQGQFQTSLSWTEGKMMFSFQWSLLAIVPVFLWSLGFDKWQRRTANGLVHLLCGHGVLAGSRGSGKGGFPWSSAPVCGRSLQSPGERERNHGPSQTWKSGLFIAQPRPDGGRFRRFSRTGGSTTGPRGLSSQGPGCKATFQDQDCEKGFESRFCRI